MATFAELLAARLAQAGAPSIATLAKKSGVDQSTIRYVLREGRNPRSDTVEKICHGLGETVESFMGNSLDQSASEMQALFEQLEPREREIVKGVARSLLAQDRKAG